MKPSKFKEQGGVYKITNVINGKVYIGRTKCMYRRSHQYIYNFKNRRYNQINDYMLNSMIKYGFSNFTFTVIELCSSDVIEDREMFWMNYFKSTDRNIGYNLRVDSSGGMVTHDSTRTKISSRLKAEWAAGVRDQHSVKLKESWEFRDRDYQATVMRKNLTKYIYKVTIDGEVTEMYYSELKAAKLHGVLSKFGKAGNLCEFKGYTIERVSVHDR